MQKYQPATPPNPSPFLKLPAELRNHIYDIVLISTKVFRLDDIFIYIHPEEVLYPLHQPPLTCVCRQVRSETLPIFYRDNIFFTDSRIDLFNDYVAAISLLWLDAIGGENRKMLERFYVSSRAEWTLDMFFEALGEEISVKTVAPKGELERLLLEARPICGKGEKVHQMNFS